MSSFINDTGSNNSMLFSSNQIPASNSCGGQCTSYQNGGGGYGFSGDQPIPGFRLPEVKSYLNVGVNSDTNLGASKQYTPNTISGGKGHRSGHGRRSRQRRTRRLMGGANDLFYGFTGNDASVPAFRGSYPPVTLGNNASINSVGGKRRSRKLRYRGGGINYADYDSKNTFYGFNGENQDNISLFKGSYAPVAIGDNDVFTGRTIGGYRRRRTHSRKHKKNTYKSKRHNRSKVSHSKKHKYKRSKMHKMMSRHMPMGMSMNGMNMGNTKKNMRSKLFKSLIGGRGLGPVHNSYYTNYHNNNR